jgi:hypothetical protein
MRKCHGLIIKQYLHNIGCEGHIHDSCIDPAKRKEKNELLVVFSLLIKET